MSGPELSIEQALNWAHGIFNENHVSDDGILNSGAIDSKVLLCACLGCEPVYLHTWPEKLLTKQQVELFQNMVEKRTLGHPVAHIVGYRDFWTLRLAVSDATLIPRPETELLVELVLELPLPKMSRILDLGTGTGAIALALASENKHWSVIGLDKNPDAVSLAAQNGDSNHLPDVEFIQSDWFSALNKQQKFDLIVTNPPYVEENDFHLKKGDVRFEPASALTSGLDGLDDIRIILGHSLEYLTSEGWLLIEHGNQQGDAIASMFTSHGFVNVRTVYDLNKQPRVTMGNVK